MRRFAGEWRRHVVTMIAVVVVSTTTFALETTSGFGAPAEGETITIGVVSPLEGPFAGLGQQGIWGFKVALVEAGATLQGTGPLDPVTGAVAGGKRIQVVIEPTDASPGRAVEAARRLIEQRRVDVFIGPLSGGEGLAIKEYAKTQLDKTFISGAASVQNLTLRDPAPNYFRFSADAVQMTAGLGAYAYTTIGLRKVATIGQDYAFPYDQVGAFVLDYCRAGGQVVQQTWVPIGTSDYSSYIVRIPRDADGILAVLSGTDVLNFIKALDQFGRRNLKMMGGAVTVDPIMIRALGARAEGIVAGTAVAVLNTPEYTQYAATLRRLFPSSPGPGLNDVFYYTATKSLLMALNQVGGDLSNRQQRLKEALSRLEWTTPVGPVRLDGNRQGIVTTFITRVENGQNVVVKTNLGINQTLGVPPGQFLQMGPFSRTNPACRR